MLRKNYFGVLCYLQLLIGWIIAAEECNYTYTIEAGRTYYLYPPYYPNTYTGPYCRHKVIAPDKHEIVAECRIEIMPNDENSCDKLFIISTTGDLTLNDAEGFCGFADVNRTSKFNSMAFGLEAITANGMETPARFLCSVNARQKDCECGWSKSSRIVGGEDAELGEFPSMASLIDFIKKEHICGATIISHRSLLTAKHCIDTSSQLENYGVLVGHISLDNKIQSPYTKLYRIENLIEPPYTDDGPNDIVLLRTAQDMVWSEAVGPACLPFSIENEDPDGEDVVLAGWGSKNFRDPPSDILQKAIVTYVSSDNCTDYFDNLSNRTQFCTYAAGKDACQYDSGGPIMFIGARQFLLGVISFGNICGEGAGVNTKVAWETNLNWIQTMTPEQLCRKPINVNN